MNIWHIGSIIYFALVILTLIPVLVVLFGKIKIKVGEGGPFSESTYFNEEEKKRLNQHYRRISGALIFQKNQVLKFKRFHYYTQFWTIPSLVTIPVLIQYIKADDGSKLFLTLISAFCAILLSFHKAFKVEENYRKFRLGESSFYDIFRRFLDRPQDFGDTKEKQIEAYFAEFEDTRKFLRETELSGIGSLKETKEILKSISET